MKLKRAVIENFKGLKGPLEIDFTSPSFRTSEPEVRQLTCLIGDNGSGKTTILQAIALTLSLATRRIETPSQFAWRGFQIDRVSSLGPPRVELVVSFDDEEITAAQDVYEQYRLHAMPRNDPSRYVGGLEVAREISLNFDGHVLQTEVRQMWGRSMVRSLEKVEPGLARYYPKLGDVFWFDQLRDLGSVISGQGADGNGSTGWAAGIERLREYLIGMWGYHTSSKRRDGRDYIELLEGRFAELFPGTTFLGIEPRENVLVPLPSDFYFLLERDGKTFDFAEMSSGEQAAFPLLFEFARLDIGNSIVLIDELELHLHPPAQRALLGMLWRIGPDCQFIITTHSPYLEEVIPDDHEVRLPGGRRCL